MNYVPFALHLLGKIMLLFLIKYSIKNIRTFLPISARWFIIYLKACSKKIQLKDQLSIRYWDFLKLINELKSFWVNKFIWKNFFIQYFITKTYLKNSKKSRRRRKKIWKIKNSQQKKKKYNSLRRIWRLINTNQRMKLIKKYSKLCMESS